MNITGYIGFYHCPLMPNPYWYMSEPHIEMLVAAAPYLIEQAQP